LGFDWLEAPAFRWDPKTAPAWNRKFSELEAFRNLHGDCLVPARWEENTALGMWVINQRRMRKAGKLSPDRIARLDTLGFYWGANALSEGRISSADPTRIVDYSGASWSERFTQLAAYKEEFGHCLVPARWNESPALGRWVVHQRRVRKAGKLSPDRIARLEALGFDWGASGGKR
jgi:hypothetical protein